MNRTGKLATLDLNADKIDSIHELERRYSEAEDRFLLALVPTVMWRHVFDKPGFRDWAKANDLYSKNVNVHLVDQAAVDAIDTWMRHIELVLAVFQIRAKLYWRVSGELRHYACSSLANHTDIGLLFGGGLPERPKIKVTEVQKAEVCRFLHRHLRDAFKKMSNPRAHLARSFSLDESEYTSFTVERRGQRPAEREYVVIIGLEPNERIVLPLAGVSRVSGIIKLVMNEGPDRAQIHVTYAITPLGAVTGPEKLIHWGITEVATDQGGRKYGQGYGAALVKITEEYRRLELFVCPFDRTRQ